MSSFWDKIVGFFNKEAKDVGEMLDSAKDKLDAELTKRERELEMSPSEKIDAITKAADERESELDRIAEKVEDEAALTEAKKELAEMDVLDRLDPDKAEPTAEAGADAAEAEPGAEAGADAADDEPEVAADREPEAGKPGEPGEPGEGAAGKQPEAAPDKGPVSKPGPAKEKKTYDKTMGEIKYERARAAADDLLDELRDEIELD